MSPKEAKVLVASSGPESPELSALTAALSDAGHNVLALSTSGIGFARLNASLMARRGEKVDIAVFDLSLSRSLLISPQEGSRLISELKEFFPGIGLIAVTSDGRKFDGVDRVVGPGMTPQEIARMVTDFHP
jgi:hypothetical protein